MNTWSGWIFIRRFISRWTSSTCMFWNATLFFNRYIIYTYIKRMRLILICLFYLFFSAIIVKIIRNVHANWPLVTKSYTFLSSSSLLLSKRSQITLSKFPKQKRTHPNDWLYNFNVSSMFWSLVFNNNETKKLGIKSHCVKTKNVFILLTLTFEFFFYFSVGCWEIVGLWIRCTLYTINCPLNFNVWKIIPERCWSIPILVS